MSCFLIFILYYWIFIAHQVGRGEGRDTISIVLFNIFSFDHNVPSSYLFLFIYLLGKSFNSSFSATNVIQYCGSVHGFWSQKIQNLSWNFSNRAQSHSTQMDAKKKPIHRYSKKKTYVEFQLNSFIFISTNIKLATCNSLVCQ